jgi:serine phosphatase RsbU (regulator of sigma subunit)
MEESLSTLQCAAASRPVRDHSPEGDRWLALPQSRGLLVVVVDALGHGAEAAEAAEAACAIVSAHPEETPAALLTRCHEGLRKTRGVALSMVSFDEPGASLTWLGVGNVQGLLVRARAASQPRRSALVLRPGTLGRRLPHLTSETLAVAPGDVLVLATDGIAPAFASDVAPGIPARDLAERLLSRHFRGDDDGLVAVVVCGDAR